MSRHFSGNGSDSSGKAAGGSGSPQSGESRDFPADMKGLKIDSELTRAVPEHFAREHQAVPLYRKNGSIVMAVTESVTSDVLEYVKFRAGSGVDFVLASPETILSLIDDNYGARDETAETRSAAVSEDIIRRIVDEAASASRKGSEADGVSDFSSSSPVVKLSNAIIEEAFFKRASDIHMEPYEEECRVRYRIDGVLYVFHRLPLQTAPILTSRLKVMCGLNIAEKRQTQQGRMKFRTSRGETVECRVSIVPVIFGEKIAIRILDGSPFHLTLRQLGFEDSQLADFDKAVKAENGMALIAGPTGSGKTTTLYSTLSEISGDDVNIMTVEDPIEYNLSGINQVQVREDIGLTFSECLRSFLRQDPDVILVGEIRDSKTADIAIKAALTGHLMLSTIHTGDALSSVIRLLDMGIEPFLIASSLHAVVAQRLVRVICANCKKSASATAASLSAAGISPEACPSGSVCEGAGCEVCSSTGYRGREAAYEVAVIDEELRGMIVSRAPLEEMRRWASGKGIKTMRQSAVEKLSRGVTTVEEVVRNTPPDNRRGEI